SCCCVSGGEVFSKIREGGRRKDDSSRGGRERLTSTLLLLLCLSLWSQQAEAAVHSSFRQLSGREKKEMQKEILSILGLPGRPRPHPPLRPPSSAPLFMLDLYHAMSADGEDEGNEILMSGPAVGTLRGGAQVHHAALPTLSTHTPPLGTVVSEADTVMSFVNLVEHERDLLQPRPYWKEFRFDLTPLPKGETVTAAEFRIYKTLTVGQRANRTLHISVYEIQRESRIAQGIRISYEDLSLLKKVSFELTGHPIIATEAGPRSKQPFMVTFFRESQVPCRPPRAVKPHPRKKKVKYDLPLPAIHINKVGQPCRKHELYVSFSDLGWKDWVLAPTGYSAYYCQGECFYPLGSCMNATNHALIQQVVHLIKPDEVPKACCAPKKLSPISVLFYDDSNNVILKKHRNMVVKTCGCQ
uniref:Bone morphogenetic protein 8a n=1 Tax=Oryzias latipes TaxID=8090 RepID=A0A3P9M5E7_ORYLA